jgi:hypothetical protein
MDNIKVDLKKLEGDSICLVQDKDQWQALVNVVTYLCIL